MKMTRYLISFPSDAMDHIPDEEGPAVADAAHAVVQEITDAGVFVFAGGLHEEVSLVATDGTVTDAPAGRSYIGGLTIIDVPSREEALTVGHQDRRRLPLPSGVPRSRARPGRGQLIGSGGLSSSTAGRCCADDFA